MKVLKMKRKKIIEALRLEPLRPNSFATDFVRGHYISLDTCPVCAVGAALRAHNVSPLQGWAVMTSERDGGASYLSFGAVEYDSEQECYENCATEAEGGAYMHALSRYFESMWMRSWDGRRGRRKVVTRAFREKLVKFVEANFPAVVEVKVDR